MWFRIGRSRSLLPTCYWTRPLHKMWENLLRKYFGLFHGFTNWNQRHKARTFNLQVLLKFYYRTFINVDRNLSTWFQHNRNVFRYSQTGERGSNEGKTEHVINVNSKNRSGWFRCCQHRWRNSLYISLKSWFGWTSHLLFFKRKWYMAYQFTNNTARGNYLGYMSRMTYKIKTYSQSVQLRCRSSLPCCSLSLACQLVRSLARSHVSDVALHVVILKHIGEISSSMGVCVAMREFCLFHCVCTTSTMHLGTR